MVETPPLVLVLVEAGSCSNGCWMPQAALSCGGAQLLLVQSHYPHPVYHCATAGIRAPALLQSGVMLPTAALLFLPGQSPFEGILCPGRTAVPPSQ